MTMAAKKRTRRKPANPERAKEMLDEAVEAYHQLKTHVQDLIRTSRSEHAQSGNTNNRIEVVELLMELHTKKHPWLA